MSVCGHDRDTLVWACGFVDGPTVHHCRKWLRGEYDAARDVCDPVKLGEMMASEGRRLGIDSLLCTVNDSDTLAFAWWGHAGYLRATPMARAILAAWLQLPNGAREQAEKVLRGDL